MARNQSLPVLKSELILDHDFFELELPGVTVREKLASYCNTYDLSIESYFHTNDTYWIPGHYILGLFRKIIPQLHEKYESFPLQTMEDYVGSNGGPHEKRFFVNDHLVVKMQLRTGSSKTKYWFYVEFSARNEGIEDEILMNGLFAFMGTPSTVSKESLEQEA